MDHEIRTLFHTTQTKTYNCVSSWQLGTHNPSLTTAQQRIYLVLFNFPIVFDMLNMYLNCSHLLYVPYIRTQSPMRA